MEIKSWIDVEDTFEFLKKIKIADFEPELRKKGRIFLGNILELEEYFRSGFIVNLDPSFISAIGKSLKNLSDFTLAVSQKMLQYQDGESASLENRLDWSEFFYHLQSNILSKTKHLFFREVPNTTSSPGDFYLDYPLMVEMNRMLVLLRKWSFYRKEKYWKKFLLSFYKFLFDNYLFYSFLYSASEKEGYFLLFEFNAKKSGEILKKIKEHFDNLRRVFSSDSPDFSFLRLWGSYISLYVLVMNLEKNLELLHRKDDFRGIFAPLGEFLQLMDNANNAKGIISLGKNFQMVYEEVFNYIRYVYKREEDEALLYVDPVTWKLAEGIFWGEVGKMLQDRLEHVVKDSSTEKEYAGKIIQLYEELFNRLGELYKKIDNNVVYSDFTTFTPVGGRNFIGRISRILGNKPEVIIDEVLNEMMNFENRIMYVVIKEVLGKNYISAKHLEEKWERFFSEEENSVESKKSSIAQELGPFPDEKKSSGEIELEKIKENLQNKLSGFHYEASLKMENLFGELTTLEFLLFLFILSDFPENRILEVFRNLILRGERSFKPEFVGVFWSGAFMWHLFLKSKYDKLINGVLQIHERKKSPLGKGGMEKKELIPNLRKRVWLFKAFPYLGTHPLHD